MVLDTRQNSTNISDILNRLPDIMDAARDLREIAIGNLVLIGEIPAPTFREKRRVQELIHRLIDCGVPDCSMDDADNAIAILPGTEGQENILVAANVDSIFDQDKDHSITVQPDAISGCGLNSSLSISAMATLPTLLDKLGIRLKSNLILLATARSAGRGNLEGVRYFLSHNQRPIRCGICLKGAPIGRLSYTSIGMLRGEIVCRVPSEFDWTRFGATGAVLAINQVINRITSIPLPRKPITNIVLGSIIGGTTYDRVAQQVIMKFEIRSEDGGMIPKIQEQMHDIVDEVAAQSGAEVLLDIFAQREPGGIEIGHPLVRCCRRIMSELKIQTRIVPSTSEHSALIDTGIPAVTIGLTSSHSLNDDREQMAISPLYKGYAQLVALLLAIDGGLADEV